ncbi:MAG: hypothetical protein AAFO69_02465 [Bacteroidota bacterium]
MFSLIKREIGVKEFSFYKEELFFLRKDGVITLFNLDLSNRLTDPKYPGNIFLLEDHLVWQDMFENSMIYNCLLEKIVHDGKLLEKKYMFSDIDLSTYGLIAAFSTVPTGEETYFFDLKKSSLYPEPIHFSISINGGKCLYGTDINRRKFFRTSLQNEVVWEFKIEGYYHNALRDKRLVEFSSLTGLHDNVLWIVLTSGKILGLSNETGLQRYTLESFPISDSDTTHQKPVALGRSMQIDINTGLMFGIHNKHYVELDLKQNDLHSICTTLPKSTLDANIVGSKFPFDDDYIYFCDDRQGKIAVFDRHWKEVVWSHQLDIKQEGIAQILEMKYQDHKWYILDRHQTLHIFERTA